MSAYQQCLEAQHELTPSWVNEDEVINLEPTKTVTFIQGDLVSKWCLIEGRQIRSFLKSQTKASKNFTRKEIKD